LRDGDRRTEIQGQTRQKLLKPYLKNEPGMVIHTYNPSYSEGRCRRIKVQGQLRQNYKTLSENQTKSKRTVGAWLR
jgi:hypothetical protein